MKRSEWQRAYDPDPVRLEARVRRTLANLDAAPAARPRALRTALIAALVLALTLVTFRRRDDFILGLDESYYKN